jgi:hypothetical protein
MNGSAAAHNSELGKTLTALLLGSLVWLLALNAGASSTIYSNSDWTIQISNDDTNLPLMEIVLNGITNESTSLFQIQHQSDHFPGEPEVGVVYSSGYVRLKQNADPLPPIPFGSSFVLGPAYWTSPANYHHHSTLTRLEIDTSSLPPGPLRMRAYGTNGDFEVIYDLTLPRPNDLQTRMHVTQTCTATANIAIDPIRQSENQGFKIVQVSSMFIHPNWGAARSDYHDGDAVRCVNTNFQLHQVSFLNVSSNSLLFPNAVRLGSTWLDVLHTDDAGWQGNTPNVRVILEELPPDAAIFAQGFIAYTTNPNDDNVGVWLNDSRPISQTWTNGKSARVAYWLLAQDDPPSSLPPLTGVFQFLHPRRLGNVFSCDVQTITNATYVLEYKDTLDDTARWVSLPPVVGDGTVRTISDTNPVVAARFYRL